MGSPGRDAATSAMSEKEQPSDSPVDRVHDMPRILAALRAGVAEAFRRHVRDGLPIAVWQDGKVVWIPPEDIPELE